MSLMLHCGSTEIDFDGLRSLETPEPTATHVPIPHHRLVAMVAHTLAFYGHEVTEQHHGVTPDGQRYFGILRLKSDYGDYDDTVGLRNSHDRSFPVGIGFGSHVFVCDNLAMIADQVIKTKHTQKLKQRLPGLIGEMIEPLTDQREAQARTFDHYRKTYLTVRQVDHVIMSLYRNGVVNVTRIAEVVEQWERPAFDWGPQTCWRLFNAVTFVLTGRVVGNPQATTELHQIINGVCEAA